MNGVNGGGVRTPRRHSEPPASPRGRQLSPRHPSPGSSTDRSPDRRASSPTPDLKSYRRSWRTPSASFASSTPRFKESKPQSPPVTKYSPNGHQRSSSAVVDSNFVSTTPRWYQDNQSTTRVPTESQWVTPAPTSYSPDNGALESKRGDLGSVSSFRSTSPRYFISKPPVNTCSPPPTAYRVEEVHLDSKKGIMSKSSFQSTTPRLFSDKLAHPTESPGPTVYKYESVDLTSNRGNLSAASFKSTTKRTFTDADACPTDAPAVTRYSPNHSSIEPDEGLISTMRSTSRRLFCDKVADWTDSPPVTAYSPQVDGTFEKATVFPSHQPLQSQTSRFESTGGIYDAIKNAYPGPGEYYLAEVPESVDEAILRRLSLKQRIDEVRQSQAEMNGESHKGQVLLVNNVW